MFPHEQKILNKHSASLVTLLRFWFERRYLYTWSKNDVISSVWKRYCAL